MNLFFSAQKRDQVLYLTNINFCIFLQIHSARELDFINWSLRPQSLLIHVSTVSAVGVTSVTLVSVAVSVVSVTFVSAVAPAAVVVVLMSP